MNYFKKVLSPDIFHGFGKKPPFFEGWYYKLINKNGTARYAVIPGIILGEDAHAFIQILDGTNGHSTYHSFEPSAFWANKHIFEIRIGESYFSNTKMILDVTNGAEKYESDLEFIETKPWPVSILSPGIMGWYAWVPNMECYHGVLSFDHLIEGHLKINSQEINFSGGRGYIEKDWGQSFPNGWIWFQSNHFENKGISLTASIAEIPWMSGHFPGFIIGLWINDHLFRFATYTGAKTTELKVSDKEVTWKIEDKIYALHLNANREDGGLLRAPTKVSMGTQIRETINASVQATLIHRKTNQVLFTGHGKYAGLEIHGEINNLLP